MSEEDCQKEAEALNDVMNLVTGASDRAQSEETNQAVFGKDNNSVMGKDADETVATFMASESLKASLNNNSDTLEDDAFGMSEAMTEDEKEDLKTAMSGYYEKPENKNGNNKEALTNLGQLFGFTKAEMNDLLAD